MPTEQTETPMPLAIAVLQESIVAYALVVCAVAGLLRAAYVPHLLPAFTGVAATLLALLAYLPAAPPARGFLLVALGIALFNAEFRFTTFGCAGLGGLTAAFYGSWTIMQPAATGTGPWLLRLTAAAVGTIALLATVVRGWRRRTLPSD